MSGLYDVGDEGGRENRVYLREDGERSRILPVRSILIAIGIAILAIWQADKAGLLAPRESYDGAVTSPNFSACADASSDDCVIDNDSFIHAGVRIRIADVDVARIANSSCPDEADRGQRAAARLRELLNAGAFEIRGYPPYSDDDGEKLSSVIRAGQSIGTILVGEGLARNWDQPTPWCQATS